MIGSEFDVGDLVELAAEFRDLDGVAIDPTTVSFKMKAPDGTITTYVYGTDAELTRAALGRYRVNWPIAQNGIHAWRFESTGTGQAAEQAIFVARKSAVE